ncbi:50S ribosomal protein L29 [bacterium]|jgi:ribosomal protein L29|nr:50S ribosomal protein L29 [bacterium]NBX98377.1 50S ribosomal protein L29 [bacterium]NDC93719.1 50S ribosomal protein L29 [bacterium]NDD82860.1 50S ribosomal protein L29 [bacterium]NDG28655.1 50S ribosomal protein L29 [bacterium]
MKVVEIRKLDTPALALKCNELRAEIIEMRRRLHMGEVQNTRAIRGKRKDLARIMTVMSEQLSKENM